jgi:hypothetical protein
MMMSSSVANVYLTDPPDAGNVTTPPVTHDARNNRMRAI